MLSNHQQLDASKTQTGGKASSHRRLRLAFVTAFSALAASAVLIPAQPSAVSAAASQVWTVTISGDCNGAATSDWQSATGVDPTTTNALLISIGDTLRIKNQCDGSQQLFIDAESWGSLNIPSLSSTPIFSDGETWTNGAGGNLNFEKTVDLIFSVTTGGFRLSSAVTWADNQPAFSNYYGRYVVGTFGVTSGGNPVSKVIANQVAAISPINVTFTGLGVGSYVNIANLPQGLTTTCRYQPGTACASPVTISGTPSEDGTFDVTFTESDAAQGTSINLSNLLQIVVGPALSPSALTVAGTEKSVISATTAFTASNFTGAVSYADTAGTLPAGLLLSSSTGVVSGTPTAASTATVTITATGATAGSATATITFAIVAAPVITPATQTVSGTADTAIAASTTFASANFTGAVSYAVTTGTLPAGLLLSSSTGVVSGTPTAASTATVTITATGATAGSATATITFAIESAPVVTTTTLPAVTTTVPKAATTTTTTTTTVSVGAPVLVTAANRAQLEAAPGAAVAVINGKAVEVETVKVEATATPEALQQAAKNIVSDISSVLPAGVKNPIAVVNTPDGAELTGLMVNPDDPTEKLSVPVDSVTLIKAGDSRVLISALNQTNLPGEVAPGGVLQVTRGGYVAAQAFGLPGSETGEIVLMSTPRLLQTFTVNANGSFNGQVALPKDIAFGSHTVVMATKSAKVSLGIKLVRTRMQFRIKRVMGTTIFKNRAKVVKRGGGIVSITGAGRCKANSTRVVMSAKPGPCFITVKQAAKGTNKAIYYRFTVAVLTKLPKKK